MTTIAASASDPRIVGALQGSSNLSDLTDAAAARANLGVGSGGGGPGSDTTAARLTDPRFYGIERVNLRAKYGAPLDGTSHPMTQAAALAAYPNCGATGSIEQDTAAWLQGEYDLRTGSGGIICLPDGAQMQVSQQIYLQNAAKVWFHGGRGCYLYTAGCGSVPAIRVSHADQSRNAIPLRDLYLQAKATPVYVSTSAGGTAHTGYVAGSTALLIDNTQGAVFERIGWNGYDTGTQFGDNTFGDTFREWSATGCNKGVSHSQTAGLNSMERMRFQDGAAANCNYGFFIDLTYGSNSQGGSIFVQDNSIDYNIVRASYYKGAATGQTSCGNSFHLIGNHIETTGACSGTTLARMFTQGALFASHNELYEGDGGHPPGIFEVADNSSATASNNRLNSTNVPIFYSSTANQKRVNGTGNVYQDITIRPVLLSDGLGTRMQPAIDDGDILELYNDADPGLWGAYYGKILSLYYYAGPGNFTIPNDSTFNFPINYCMKLIQEGQPSGSTYPPHAIKIVGASGVTVDSYPGNTLPAVTTGAMAWVRKNGPNNWRIYGTGLTVT